MISVYQVDAFTTEKFKGNPAAVCPLEEWLSDTELQNIAAEINLSETAFFVPHQEGFYLRWFTPTTEVRLCGHATLATSHVIFHHLGYEKDKITFYTNKAGQLHVKKIGDEYQMDFPSDTPVKKHFDYAQSLIAPKLLDTLYGTDDLILVVESEDDVLNCDPDFAAIKKIDHRCVVVTAKGQTEDFVSRVFAPAVGIDEDPVTGSAHTALTPYWSSILNKNKLNATQVSRRSGNIQCELKDNRVLLTGNAITTIKGHLI